MRDAPSGRGAKNGGSHRGSISFFLLTLSERTHTIAVQVSNMESLLNDNEETPCKFKEDYIGLVAFMYTLGYIQEGSFQKRGRLS